MNTRYLLTLLLSCLSLLAWANRIDQQIAQEMAQTVAQSYQEGSLRTSTQSRMPNAPTDAGYLSSIGELMMGTDNPSLPPITLKENKLTDCYLNVASELNDDLYNEAKAISIDMSGQSGNKTMRFKIQDYDRWKDHLCVWYNSEMFYEAQYGSKLTISDDGIFTINLEDGTYDSSYSTYLLMGSDQRGTLHYDMEILDDNTGSSQYSMTNGTICFIQKLATQISPNTITGPAGTAIPVIATLSNIDPVLYGKAADVIIVVSPISNPNIQIQYKGTTIEGIFAYYSVVVPIRIEAFPDASSLEIPFTLQSDEVIPSGANVKLLSYVSGFQGNWGHSPVVITPADPKSYSIQSSLTGLSLATESETVVPGGTYEGVLSVTDATQTKLPQEITVKVADSEELWNDFGYDPRTGSIVIRNITAGLVIQATAEPFQSYSITTQLQNMDITGLPEGNTIQEGQSLRFTLSAQDTYRLPATIQVKQNGEALSTEAYTYNSTSGEVMIPSVQGPVEITASAISGMVINETEKEVEGTISEIHVETDGSASLTLQSLNTNLMEISSNSDAQLMVATNSQIQSLNNSGKVKLESIGDAALQLQSIDNSGELVLDESLKLSVVPQSIDNEGIFMDNTGMITQVSGSAALELSMTLPAQSSYTQGETHSLTVKARIAAEWVKIIFKWQKKQSDGWVEVKSEEIEPFSLRSDGLIELTSTYDLPLNESGTYRCVVTNFKSEGSQTTLFTETSVTVNTPVPEPDPTPDPIILYRVTIPQVEGATVLTYGSMYVEEWEDFSFRIHIQEGYDATNMSVEANGTVLLPDARGLYTIEHITDNVTVTITGIVKETPTSIDTIGADATAVWTSRGQIHIRLRQEATVTVLNYSGRLVKLFKGSAGDYAIPVQAGSYIVAINDRVYKVVL